MTGWLAEQLPRPLAEDPFVPRFLGIFEQVADSVIGRIDAVEHHLDTGLAPAAFLRWLAGWLGVTLDASLPLERQRAVVQAAGTLLPWRGTRRGLEGLLAAYTGGDVEVRDGGGVFGPGGAPLGDRRVEVRLQGTGGLEPEQLLALIRAEVPADAEVELRVAARLVERTVPPDDTDEVETAVAAPDDPGADGFLPAMEGG